MILLCRGCLFTPHCSSTSSLLTRALKEVILEKKKQTMYMTCYHLCYNKKDIQPYLYVVLPYTWITSSEAHRPENTTACGEEVRRQAWEGVSLETLALCLIILPHTSVTCLSHIFVMRTLPSQCPGSAPYQGRDQRESH